MGSKTFIEGAGMYQLIAAPAQKKANKRLITTKHLLPASQRLHDVKANYTIGV